MDWNCKFHNLLASFWHILCLFSPILSHQWLKMQTIARTNFALVLFLTVREYLARSYKFENCSCCCDLCSNTSRKASNTHLLHQVLHGFPESLWKSQKSLKVSKVSESLWKSLRVSESLVLFISRSSTRKVFRVSFDLETGNLGNLQNQIHSSANDV